VCVGNAEEIFDMTDVMLEPGWHRIRAVGLLEMGRSNRIAQTP
jgi:hypothetical protein